MKHLEPLIIRTEPPVEEVHNTPAPCENILVRQTCAWRETATGKRNLVVYTQSTSRFLSNWTPSNRSSNYVIVPNSSSGARQTTACIPYNEYIVPNPAIQWKHSRPDLSHKARIYTVSSNTSAISIASSIGTGRMALYHRWLDLVGKGCHPGTKVASLSCKLVDNVRKELRFLASIDCVRARWEEFFIPRKLMLKWVGLKATTHFSCFQPYPIMS